jgi:hypothetical protein
MVGRRAGVLFAAFDLTAGCVSEEATEFMGEPGDELYYWSKVKRGFIRFTSERISHKKAQKAQNGLSDRSSAAR